MMRREDLEAFQRANAESAEREARSMRVSVIVTLVGVILGIAVVLALLGGCVAEGDKRLNAQNRGAGEFIEKTAGEPAVKRAGADVRDNADVIAKGICEPETREPYSPKASADARKQAADEHTNPWWVGAGGLLCGLLATAFPILRAVKVGKLLQAVVAGVDKAVEAGAIDKAEVYPIMEEAGGAIVKPDELRETIRRIKEKVRNGRTLPT